VTNEQKQSCDVRQKLYSTQTSPIVNGNNGQALDAEEGIAILFQRQGRVVLVISVLPLEKVEVELRKHITFRSLLDVPFDVAKRNELVNI